MNRSDLVNQLAERFSLLNRCDAELAVEVLLDTLAQALTKGKRVEIRGFGSFSLVTRKARMGRNPRSGEAVPTPERRLAHFKPGKALREAIAARPVDQRYTQGQPEDHRAINSSQ